MVSIAFASSRTFHSLYSFVRRMIDDYEHQVDAMRKRFGVNKRNIGAAKRQPSQDRYNVKKGGYGKHYEIDMKYGDEDSLTSLTDDLTYLQSARRESATRIRKELEQNADDATILPGSVNDPLDVTMYDTFRDEEHREDRLHARNHPFNHRESDRRAESLRNTRSGRFSSNEWKESIRRRRSLFNTEGDDEEGDYGEADEDWPGARIPLNEPTRRTPPQRQTQPRRNRRLVDKLNEFDAALEETHSLRQAEEEARLSQHQHQETERLKRALIDQRQKYDEEKGALYIEIERLKRDHGLEVDKLRSDLDKAKESHQTYLKKLNEVIDYHEALHEKETATMNKIVEQVKKEKREEVARLSRELEKLKSAPPKKSEFQPEDPDMQQCIMYLTRESETQKHRRAQFMDTMHALQSIAAKTTKSGAGFTPRDLQDIDGLLDMLHHVYNVSENSHQKTLCMSHMLIEECTEMSKTANDFQKMKQRLDALERESSIQVETQLRGPRGEQACGNSFHDITQTIGSFDELTKSMETSLYRGLGLIP